MIRTRASALAFGTTIVGASMLSGLLAIPVAHADDPLVNIIGQVRNDRGNTRCPAFVYNPALEATAQNYARTENPGDSIPGGYNGQTLAFKGSGDPTATATNSAYRQGAGGMISNCEFTEFGAGMVRHDDREVSVVTLIFGKPAAAPVVVTPPEVKVDPAKTEPVKCPDGTTVPAGQTCPVAPKDAVTLAFDRGGLQWTANITSTADIAGNCTYDATNDLLPGVSRTFNIAPKGKASLKVPAPPPLATYHIVVACSGPFNGQNVEFGRVEQDVP